MTQEKNVINKTDEVSRVVDASRIGSKNVDMMEEFHRLSQRKAEIEEQIECSNCADKKTSLTLELDNISKKIISFWEPTSGYKHAYPQ